MPIYSDIPAKKDLLNRRQFAVEISKSIVKGFQKNHESVVLGLNGDWGSGKSTLLGFIREELKKQFNKRNVRTITYEFNPWMFSGQESLQREFLEGLLENLKDNLNKVEEFRVWTERALKYLKIVKFIPGGYGKDMHEAIEEIVKGSELFGSISTLKKHVDEQLTKEKIKLLIFLDDIDRLAPDEITEMFQLVKLNTNFQNTFFFVAYDKEVVETALKIRYGENGKKYLEKIVQVDYKVPEILTEKKKEIFFNNFNKFLKENKIKFDQRSLESLWYYQGLGQCFKSLRDVYRYLNALQFRLPAIWREVSLVDFLLLESLRVFEYEVYQKLHDLYANNRILLEDINEDKKKLLNGLTTNVRRIVNHLIQFEKTYLPKYQRDKGFTNPQNFGKYFGLQLSVNDFSVIEFEGFLTSQSRTILLRRIAENGRLDSFFNHFANLNEYGKDFEISQERLIEEILDILNDENLFLRYCKTAYNSIKNLMGSFAYDLKGMEKIVNIFTSDHHGLSFSRFTFIHWIIDDFEKIILDDSVESAFVKKQIETLKTSKDKYLKDWVHIVLNPMPHKIYCITSLFMLSYSKFAPIEYVEKMQAVLKNDEYITYLVKINLMRNTETNEPGQLLWGNLKNYLPDKLESIFKERLKETFQNSIDKNDKRDLEFAINALAKIEKST